jgi:hypothetical protein
VSTASRGTRYYKDQRQLGSFGCAQLRPTIINWRLLQELLRSIKSEDAGKFGMRCGNVGSPTRAPVTAMVFMRYVDRAFLCPFLVVHMCVAKASRRSPAGVIKMKVVWARGGLQRCHLVIGRFEALKSVPPWLRVAPKFIHLLNASGPWESFARMLAVVTELAKLFLH